jgi:lysozyme
MEGESMGVTSLEDLLVEHEGVRLKPYDDATGRPLKAGESLQGKLTIGVGRNVTDTGITHKEALALLKADIAHAKQQAGRYKWFPSLNKARQACILSMIFNMGSIEGFRKMRAAIAVKDWTMAVREMHDSLWATQIGQKRLADLTEMMKTGKWPS